tara:strand:+ start:630 stop:968 length:339 start_codon:yes stop_codon:yes gene_type:complete
MPLIFYSFWYGKITLWKSYWLVGELLNALIIILVLNLDIILFGNAQYNQELLFINFNKFTIISKLIIIIWSIYITVGIWRSAENYKGSIIWIILTLIIISYRLFVLRTIFIF